MHLAPNTEAMAPLDLLESMGVPNSGMAGGAAAHAGPDCTGLEQNHRQAWLVGCSRFDQFDQLLMGGCWLLWNGWQARAGF